MLKLQLGEKVHLFDGDKGAEGIWDYARGVLLQVAAGAGGVPYELVTGDWEHVNDRLVRAMLNEFHRAIEAAQDHLLIFQLCTRVWSWFVDAGVLAGKLAAPGYAEDQASWRTVHCRPQGWPFVHTLQDAQSKIASSIPASAPARKSATKCPASPSRRWTSRGRRTRRARPGWSFQRPRKRRGVSPGRYSCWRAAPKAHDPPAGRPMRIPAD